MLIKKLYETDLENKVDAIWDSKLVRRFGNGNYKILTLNPGSSKLPNFGDDSIDVLRLPRSCFFSEDLSISDIFFTAKFLEVFSDETKNPIMVFPPYYMYQDNYQMSSDDVSKATADILTTPELFDKKLRGCHLPTLARIAITRLEFPYNLSGKAKGMYKAFLNNYPDVTFSSIYSSSGEEGIRHFAPFFVNTFTMEKLVERLTPKGDTTINALLMSLVKSDFLPQVKPFELSVDETDESIQNTISVNKAPDVVNILISLGQYCGEIMQNLEYLNNSEIYPDSESYDDILIQASIMDAGDWDEMFEDD